MKKSIKFTIGLLLTALFVSNVLNITNAYADNDKRVIETTCKIKGTDTIIGYSNNCGSGSGFCIDRTCGLQNT